MWSKRSDHAREEESWDEDIQIVKLRYVNIFLFYAYSKLVLGV